LSPETLKGGAFTPPFVWILRVAQDEDVKEVASAGASELAADGLNVCRQSGGIFAIDGKEQCRSGARQRGGGRRLQSIAAPIGDEQGKAQQCAHGADGDPGKAQRAEEQKHPLQNGRRLDG